MMLFPTQFHSSLRCSALPRFNTLKYSGVRVSLSSIRIERRPRRLRRKLDMLGEGIGNSSEEDTNDEILG
jgi:hypothetical protein